MPPGIGDCDDMFEVFVVEVPIRSHFTRHRMWFVDLVSRLINEKTVTVPDLELNVRGSFLRKAGGKSMAGQSGRRDSHREGSVRAHAAIGFVEVDSDSSLD